MATYSIRDLEKISGIKAHTLRMWEQRYSILQPKRTDTNIRYYDEDDLRLILSISMLNCKGFKISRIASMSAEEIHKTCECMHEVCEEYLTQVNTLLLAMVELDEPRFEKVLSACTLRYGLEETMVRIIFPFFSRIGILWQTGAVCAAQEHFITNLIRQKLIVAIDAQEVPVDARQPKFMLFLPEHELHEIGLLFAAFLLRKHQQRVIYLGQAVPEEDLAPLHSKQAPDYLLTVLTLDPPKENAETFLARLSSQFPETTILAAGQAVCKTCNVPSNVKVLYSPQHLLQVLGN